MQQQALRNRLWLVAIAGILPLAMLGGISLYALIRYQQAQAELTGLDDVRALAVTLNGELRRIETALAVLGSSSALDSGDMQPFARSAARVLENEPTWQSIRVTGADGTVLLDVVRPGQAQAAAPAMPSRAVTPADGPTLGNLVRDGRGAFTFEVGVPLSRPEAPGRVLTAIVLPEAIRQVFDSYRIPENSVVSVFDGNGRRVARSRGHERFLGGMAAPTLQALMASGATEGAGLTYALEGDLIQAAFTYLQRSRWSVASGGSPATLFTDTNRSLALYGGGIVLSIVLGMLAALIVARSITRPIRQLRDAAHSLGRGEPPRIGASAFREIDEVADALRNSAQERARVEKEREDLLGAERSARSTAEEARRRLELLASAGATLSRSLEPQATLQALAHVIVPAISDWCRVDLLDGEGRLQRALTFHRDPDKTRVAIELVDKLHAAPETPGSMAWTVAPGRSHLARFTPPDEFDSIRDRDLLAFANAIGMRAYFIVPLTARGRTLGALAALQAESDREFSADDCALITELAQRAALALDNARLFAEAEAALREADRANRSKDEFLAMLGHELRNPLAPIVTALHLMARKGGGGEDGAERRIIERQVEHLSRLVDDLLDVSRITQGKIQLELEVVDLKSVVDRALELIGPLLDKRTRPLEVDAASAPVHVLGDALRLTQVVCNLLTNALKFTPADGWIGLRLAAEDGKAVIAVSDAGSGIGADLLPHVFDLFVQGRQSVDRNAGGLGLGLAIVKTMVRMHGGTVEVKSEGVSRGSTFTVKLPLAQERLAEAPPPPPERREQPATAAAARILVVDDNADACETLATMLELSGHEVRTAGNADAAMAVLEDFTPDLAILDIGLPGADGYELARRLRADSRSRHARLIALTGYGREPDRARALAGSFEEHLVKPVSPQRLLAAVGELLEQPGARSGPKLRA